MPAADAARWVSQQNIRLCGTDPWAQNSFAILGLPPGRDGITVRLMKVPTSKCRALVSMSGTPFRTVALLSTLLLSAPVILAEAAEKAADTASASPEDEYHALGK